jgi:NADH dehydrogenase
VVGAGFGGFACVRRLSRLMRGRADITLVSPTDYMLYTPLLPEVARGSIDPRPIAVPLRQALPRIEYLLGHVVSVDIDDQVAVVSTGIGPDSGIPEPTTVHWDRLVLAPGSVTRQFDIPGVAEHAHGFKTLTEAVFLHDHLLAQFDLADACPQTP